MANSSDFEKVFKLFDDLTFNTNDWAWVSATSRRDGVTGNGSSGDITRRNSKTGEGFTDDIVRKSGDRTNREKYADGDEQKKAFYGQWKGETQPGVDDFLKWLDEKTVEAAPFRVNDIVGYKSQTAFGDGTFFGTVKECYRGTQFGKDNWFVVISLFSETVWGDAVEEVTLTSDNVYRAVVRPWTYEEACEQIGIQIHKKNGERTEQIFSVSRENGNVTLNSVPSEEIARNWVTRGDCPCGVPEMVNKVS